MRILYFHQHFTTREGSGGTRSYEMARALVAAGHRVVMVCGRHAQSGIDLPLDHRGWSCGQSGGIDIIALPLSYSNRDTLLKRGWIFLRFAWASIRVMFTVPHDLLFATSTPLTAGIPGVVSRFCLRKVPFVFEVRDLWPELPRALGMRNPIALWGMSVLEWLCYRCADSCIGLSPGIVEGIRRRASRTLPVALIPNGSDLELFHPKLKGPLTITGIAPGDFVAGFTGTHGIANRLDAVLDAAAILKSRGRTTIKILLVGDGNEKDRLITRARHDGLDNCIFHPPMKKTELAKVTASLDCGLMILANIPAFYYGTSPNKFFDYAAASIPVLVNHPGWLADLIQEHQCGKVVVPDNPSALADALEELAADPLRRATCGSNARRLAEHSFARDMLARDFIGALESAARNAGPPQHG